MHNLLLSLNREESSHLKVPSFGSAVAPKRNSPTLYSNALCFIILLGISTSVHGFVFSSKGSITRFQNEKTTKPFGRDKDRTESLIFSSSAAVDSIEERTSSSTQHMPFTSIDPLLMNALQMYEELSLPGIAFDILSVSHGIQTWRECLCKGRFPIDLDFEHKIWPAEPLYTNIVDAMTTLQLPRFVLKHPETVSSVLLTLLRLTSRFLKEIQDGEQEEEEEEQDNFSLKNDNDYFEDDPTLENELDPMPHQNNDISLSIEEIKEIAFEVGQSLIHEWNDVVSGVNILDEIFGYDHSMLDVNSEINDDSIGNTPTGFGLEDGIWQHTGWREIPSLQNQISSMHELKDLMNKLGRRPTAENSNEIHKFSPRKLNNDGAMGAQFDPQMNESIGGITLSGSLTEMLPSEAVLLRGSSKALRLLFMVKKVESKLLSYEMSGWNDVPSIPLTKPLYLKRMPSAPGGPIVICLDTSWSMSGMREQLSKAVVLACVSLAHKQRRDCQVVAFSTEQGVIEAGVITPDASGIRHLLSFLSHSFGGGTDVTGALKFALKTIDSDVMSAADILLVSDGEIPNPPVSDEIMKALDHLKIQKGVEVHGLLVGKQESEPLSRLSTEIHTFLIGYDTQSMFGDTFSTTSTSLKMSPLRSHPSPLLRKSAVSYNRRCFQGRTSMALFAKYSKYEDTDRVKKNRKRKGSKSRWEDEDDNEYLPQTDQEEKNRNKNDLPVEDLFLFNVEECTKAIKLSVEELVAAQTWDPKTLEAEKEGSCWKYRDDLERAIQAINEGLVEREEEARLVLLAMVSMEHIILVGVPGTGKSVLGRRLAKLCDGFFFQRLLTKFSTPEELFGPLSLKSLENDEYRRCTTGYLPTASVAFLDEIFKANSAILNTLLTILNERKFDNAGGQELCPIKCVVGASNELPESDELVALFDRFLIRKEVLPVSDQGVLTMLSMTNLGCEERETCKIDVSDSLNEVIEALSIAVNYVSIEDEVCLIVRDLRKFMREVHSVEISDRRLVKAAGMLKISAASNGREKVDPIDCLLLQHCMWQLPEQRVFVRDWLWDHITPGCEIKQLRFLLDNIRSEVLEIVRKTSGDISGAFGGRGSDISLIESSRIETSRITSILQKSRADLSRHIELIHKANEFLWLDPDETKSLQQLLLPRAEKTLVEVEQALSDSTALQLCLEPSPQSPSNDLRFSVIENLWAEGYTPEISFTEEELSIGMKEAKKRFDLKTFRKWKRSKKLAEK